MQRRHLLDFLNQSQQNNPNYNNFSLEDIQAAIPAPVMSLKPFAGTWDRRSAAHLLRRTTFGPNIDELEKAVTQGLAGTIQELFKTPIKPSPPLNTNSKDPNCAIGETFVDKPYDSVNGEGQRLNDYRSWWWSQILDQGISINEKMLVFWHNHFSTQTNTVRDSRYHYQHNVLLRDNALGNFKTLTKKMTIDNVMMEFLNNSTNTKSAPNENYARELFELFTIGKGEQIADGNYTNYTESDVQAAAKVLTGWRIKRGDNGTNFAPFFDIYKHDTTTKQFSSVFNNQTIKNNGDKEYLDLIDMIFAKQETAAHICRKLYVWFCNYLITPEIETNIIQPLANDLFANGYEIKPVLIKLLSSEHFFDENMRGCIIKNPVDFFGMFSKQFDVKIDKSDVVKYYKTMFNVHVTFSFATQMTLGDPPSVAGWQAYYQIPSYYQMWINAVTLPLRTQFTDYMTVSKGFQANNRQAAFIMDIKNTVAKLNDPNDPNALVKDLAEFVFPIKISDKQIAYLKEFLVPNGQGDYNWSNVWDTYKKEPNNAANTNIVDYKLRTLTKAMLAMAEYHLM